MTQRTLTVHPMCKVLCFLLALFLLTGSLPTVSSIQAQGSPVNPPNEGEDHRIERLATPLDITPPVAPSK
ncbi:MAG: hypothetical protein PVH17_08300, partial [Anaerolineae bacterium]